MVCCCGPIEALNPEDDIAQSKQTSAYPGQRRQFTATDGNALQAAVSANGYEGGDLVSGTSA